MAVTTPYAFLEAKLAIIDWDKSIVGSALDVLNKSVRVDGASSSLTIPLKDLSGNDIKLQVIGKNFSGSTTILLFGFVPVVIDKLPSAGTITRVKLLSASGSAITDVGFTPFGIGDVSNAIANDIQSKGKLDQATIDQFANKLSTLYSATTATLPDFIPTLQLTGSANANAIGNNQNNTLRGNDRANVLTGKGGRDLLTGLKGKDTFRFTKLSDSSFGNTTTPSKVDWIRDLVIGGATNPDADRIDGPNPVSAANVAELGSINSLRLGAIQTLLADPNVYKPLAAATFTFTGASTRTFLALNDNNAGFSRNDGLIEITGFKGNLSALSIV